MAFEVKTKKNRIPKWKQKRKFQSENHQEWPYEQRETKILFRVYSGLSTKLNAHHYCTFLGKSSRLKCFHSFHYSRDWWMIAHLIQKLNWTYRKMSSFSLATILFALRLHHIFRVVCGRVEIVSLIKSSTSNPCAMAWWAYSLRIMARKEDYQIKITMMNRIWLPLSIDPIQSHIISIWPLRMPYKRHIKDWLSKSLSG